MKLQNLVGKKYGRLLVIKRTKSVNGKAKWLCKCDCGNECVVYATSLKSGNTQSCGCYKRENAKKLYSTVRQNDKRLYAVWNGIKQRCTNPNNNAYHNYGGRGIKICNEWANNYKSFYDWAISAGYKKGKEIDRIDNNGNYEPDNCRFVDEETQANNKRNVRLYTINGIIFYICQRINQSYKITYHQHGCTYYKKQYTIGKLLFERRYGH